jgi:phosphoglycerate dehydrogenase-like enzyme
METLRVVVLDDYQAMAEGLADWGSLSGCAVEFVHTRLADEDALVARLADADAAVLVRERTAFPAQVLERLPRLRLLLTGGMRNAAVDLTAASRRGVTVCGVEGTSPATAELAWALLLALLRHVPTEDAALRAGRWQSTVGTGLAARTLGVLGLGSLGRRMVPVARAFGMQVLAWSANLTAEAAAEAGATRVGKDELFERSDVVTLHLVLSERTRHVVGRRELELLGPRGYLVNTSRAGLVDRQALLDALHAGTIAGAALDVFDEEPVPPGDPLLTAPNTVLTPHLGFVTRDNYAHWYTGAVQGLRAFAEGQPIRVLNPLHASRPT